MTLILLVMYSVYPLVTLIIEISSENNKNLAMFIVGIVGWIVAFIFLIVLISFTRYHHKLIRRNKTTLDMLDIERGNLNNFNYDMGSSWNMEFIMGKKRSCWCFPVWYGKTGPQGDGTVFVKRGREGRILDLEEEESISASKKSSE